MKFNRSQLLNSDSKSSVDNSIVAKYVTSFTKFGRDSSEECKASLEMYTIHLRQIESGHIVKKEEDTQEQRNDILEKEQKIERIQNEIKDKTVEIKQIKEAKVKDKEEEINNLKRERDDLASQDPREVIDTGPKYKPWLFYTGAFISLLLILFIYYFYVNLGYVLFDLPAVFSPNIAFDCHPEVLNSLDQLFGNGGCKVAISIGPLLLPILFLAIAILIHFKLENLIYEEGKKYKAWIGISLFLVLVLGLDIILAIKFEERLFNWKGVGGVFGNQFPTGLIEQLKYSYKQPAFLLILGLGFVGYIIWSLITHEASKEYEKKDPENRWRRKLRRFEKQIERVQGERSYLLKKASHLIPDEIRELEKEIGNIKQSIRLIRIGGKDKLRNALIQFTIGWNQYIQYKYGDFGASEKISLVKNELNKFISSSATLRDIDQVKNEEISLVSLN
ncbi:hypothetical protein ATE92_0575 [Ulvibacter sp. MAR_2010_11]|uniref:hypothetical protein n=1 Tax=Ulvibacter sp. MAR_2010_11 TaxID=1250229 RepID=UPI000C2CCE93|nr:hypothetical protein [Ulvibacter sp. MAR_2010_11]PKA82446.1 hypothetical protein ATE92_0575 [Ulvibacter sp. MAR_2010_11]